MTNYHVMPNQEGFVSLAAKSEEAFVGGPGRILAKGTEGYACLFMRGDMVNVTEKGKDISTILLEDGTEATVPTKLLFFKGDKTYEAWTGYAKSNAAFYRSWRTRSEEPVKLKINTVLQVLGEFDDFRIVQLEDQRVGLVQEKMISKTKIALVDYGSGGGGGGGGTEWTNPAL